MNLRIFVLLGIFYLVRLILLKIRMINNDCKDICEMQLIGNILTCQDMDLSCYQYYETIYKQCLSKC